MSEKWKEEGWAQDFWYSGKVTRRRVVGWGGGAIGALMLVPAPWRKAFAQAKPYKIGAINPLSGAGAGRSTAARRRRGERRPCAVGTEPIARAARPRSCSRMRVRWEPLDHRGRGTVAQCASHSRATTRARPARRHGGCSGGRRYARGAPCAISRTSSHAGARRRSTEHGVADRADRREDNQRTAGGGVSFAGRHRGGADRDGRDGRDRRAGASHRIVRRTDRTSGSGGRGQSTGRDRALACRARTSSIDVARSAAARDGPSVHSQRNVVDRNPTDRARALRRVRRGRLLRECHTPENERRSRWTTIDVNGRDGTRIRGAGTPSTAFLLQCGQRESERETGAGS